MAFSIIASHPSAPTKRGVVIMTPAQLRLNYSLSTRPEHRLHVHRIGLSNSVHESVQGYKPLKYSPPDPQEKSERLVRANARMRRQMKRQQALRRLKASPVVDLISKPAKQLAEAVDAIFSESDESYAQPSKPKAKKPAAKKPVAKTKPAPAKAKKPKIGRSLD